MTVESKALALGGLVVGYALHETSGTNLVDFGPNTLPATLGSRGAVNGTAILPGSAAALHVSGDLGTGGGASRAVAGGSPLQLTNSMTVMCCARPTGANATTRGFAERANNWQMRWIAAPQYWLQVYIWLSGVASGPAVSISGVASGERCWPWFTFDGKRLIVGINDALEAALPLTGSITNTTDVMTLGAVSSQAFIGDMEYFMVFNRPLGLGEIRSLIIEGDSTIDRGITVGEYAFFDHVADDIAPVAASASNRVCLECGGRMRAREGNWANTSGGVMHIGCMARNTATLPTTITSSSVQADYALRAERLAMDVLQMSSRRGTTLGKNTWFGVEGNFHNTEYNTVFSGMVDHVAYNICGIGTMAAALARWRRAGPRDPVTKAAVAAVDSVITLGLATATNPSIFWQNGDFTWSAVGKALIFLNGIMDRGQWQEWVDLFQQSTIDYSNGGTDLAGGAHGGAGYGEWYTNGNRNLDHCQMRWMCWYLDPTSTTLAAYNNEKSWMDSPTAGAWQPGGVSSGLLFGWVVLTPGVQADGSDGQGFWRESHGSSTKGFWNVGNTVNADAGFETVNVDGRCFTYLHNQTQTSLGLYLLSNETYWAKKANMCGNLLLTRRNNTTGVVDSTVSARHCANYNWSVPFEQALTWKGKRTVAVNATDAAAVWLKNEESLRAVGRDPTSSWYRVLGRDLPNLFMGLDTWPGH